MYPPNIQEIYLTVSVLESFILEEQNEYEYEYEI